MIVLRHSTCRRILVLHGNLSETEYPWIVIPLWATYSIDDAREGRRGWSVLGMRMSDTWRPLSFTITKLICKLGACSLSADDTPHRTIGTASVSQHLSWPEMFVTVLVIRMRGNSASFFSNHTLTVNTQWGLGPVRYCDCRVESYTGKDHARWCK